MASADQNPSSPPAIVDDPVILINIRQTFRHGMSEQALYEATRGVWRVGEKRSRAEYALAVYGGVAREVYKIESWQPACTATYSTRRIDAEASQGRWEFTGDVADAATREKYINRSVAAYFPRGTQNPVRYVNC